MKKSILFFALLVFTTLSVFAQKDKVKAAFIVQFTRYIEWCPEYRTGDFVIGVLGDSPIYNELIMASQIKKVGAQSIVVHKYSNSSEITEANIVVISSEKSSQLTTVLSKISNSCTLVITEKSGLIKDGASISFVEADGKLLFELNKSSFQEHSLSVNSQLLIMSRKVI